MFHCRFLPVVFLLCAVVKETATADPTTQYYSSDGGTINETSTTSVNSHLSVTASSHTSSNHLNSLATLPQSTTLGNTTIKTSTEESTTTEPSTAQAETTFSQPGTESRSTTASVSRNVTESSDVTTRTPYVSPSAPTSGSTTFTVMQETSQATDTMTGNTNVTHSTEPSSGNTTASSTTTILSTGSTISGTTQRPADVTTTNSTISNSTTISSTTQRLTDVTTNNSTVNTGSTISGTTQQPADVTTTNSTISNSTTISSTTQRLTDVTTNNSTVNTGSTISGTTQRPADVTTNNSTVSNGTTITSTAQRPTDLTTNNFTISIGTTTTTSTTHRPTDVPTNNSTTTLTSTFTTGTTVNSSTSSTAPTTTIIVSTTQQPTDTTTNNPTTTAAPIPPVIVCPAVPCPLESVCLNGTCQCLSGSFLVNGRCAPAQVFPGQLHLISLAYDINMSNRSSKAFQQTANLISESLRAVLKKQRGYKQSEVVRLEPGSVQATVNNIFEDTDVTEESVNQVIDEAIAKQTNGLLKNASYTNTNLCAQEPLPCDVSSTMCTNSNGKAVCFCKEGYISILYSNTSCRACPSGQRGVENVCQPCPFGYSGFNCNDSALLAVVVISCVLGGVLLIVLALLIYGSCNRQCSKSKPDYSCSPYSGDLNQPWPTGVTPIPRASTNLDAVPQIEMLEGTRVLVDKNPTNGMSGSYDLHPEGMHTFKGKTPSRYSYLVQGHENPYFLPGDDKNN
ncbi:mucin-13 isoform X2 [Pungitius pungitius]|uniref:mucin-13 isoform X2 n=1 Tax=Pungitius pungitius TaxID=134920 RepID=UPI002E0EAF68